MTARAQLAAAHERMTPAAIAAHALRLAAIIESQERVIQTLYELVDSLEAAVTPADRPFIDRSLRIPLAEIWPEIFSPETTI